MRDLRLKLSLLDDFCLPASARAGICESEPGASAAHSQGNARSSCHPAHLGHLSSVRAARHVAGRARVASPARCPALSRRARRRCLRLTGNRMCGASLAGYDRFLSRWAGRIFHQRQRSYGNASLVAPRSLIAMPCLSVLDGFRVGNSAHTRASAQRGVRRSRPRLTSAQ